jgi:hypothetical protein
MRDRKGLVRRWRLEKGFWSDLLHKGFHKPDLAIEARTRLMISFLHMFPKGLTCGGLVGAGGA